MEVRTSLAQGAHDAETEAAIVRDAASPRSAIRNSFQAGALSEADAQALEMLSDRNRSVHSYNEGLALTIFSRLETYAKLLARWLDALEEQAS